MRPAQLRSPIGLSWAVCVLLGLVIAIDAFSIYAEVNLHSLMGQVLAENSGAFTDQDAERADTLLSLTGSMQVAVLLPTGVVFIVWFYRARVNAEVFVPGGQRKGRGWAIGSWFIPIANLWIPRQIAVDIWEASIQRTSDGSVRQASYGVLNAWWTLWVATVILDRGASRMYLRAEEPEELREAAVVLIVSDLVQIAAAVLAIVFVRRLSAMQHTKALQGPVALTV